MVEGLYYQERRGEGALWVEVLEMLVEKIGHLGLAPVGVES
jgi:hypothetical protein